MLFVFYYSIDHGTLMGSRRVLEDAHPSFSSLPTTLTICSASGYFLGFIIRSNTLTLSAPPHWTQLQPSGWFSSGKEETGGGAFADALFQVHISPP